MVARAKKPGGPVAVPLEHDIQTAILTALGTKVDGYPNKYKMPGGLYWRNSIGVARDGKRFIRFGVKGSADIMGITHGVSWHMEVKRPGGKQTEEQLEWQADVEEAGAIYRVVTSVEEAQALIAEIRAGFRGQLKLNQNDMPMRKLTAEDVLRR